jgi:8-oxo-dGTP pyrophosphatase MutT (NUDIX family)
MLFSEFTKFIPKILNLQLPAINAHLKMAPLERQESLQAEYYAKFNPRKSAVMMLFYPKNAQATIILIKRNTYAGVHSAQISFPGGKAEITDANLAETALRETFEEVGIAVTDINVVMPFTEIYIPPSNFLVAPFLGISMDEPNFNPSAYEVAELIELPLDDLLDDSIVINSEIQTSLNQSMKVPAFKVGDHIIWGATAMILSELKETIKSALK